MQKVVRRQLVELLDTVQEGISYAITQQDDSKKYVLADCRQALNQIARAIAESGADSQKFYQETLQAVQESLAEGVGPAQGRETVQRLRLVQSRLRGEPVQTEVVFLPYKFSMWDCMESVWQATSEDPSCDCCVIPIPYYDRNSDHSLGAKHYEGTLFPQYIQAIDYRAYDFALRQPDIIYIHNPYDEGNLVTSVDPAFYSYELKKHTNCLVYIPYYTSGYIASLKLGSGLFSALRYVDYAIVQSEEMKRYFVDLGLNNKRILALGNPKFDAVIRHKNDSLPFGWNEKLQNKTVFLFNTSLSDLLSHNERWIPWLYSMLTNILKNKNCAVIWRPHPLMEATLSSMRPGQLQLYQEMKQRLCEADNLIYDEQGDVYPAFHASHALISDYSSLMWQYGVSGKPILCLTGSKTDRVKAEYRILDDSEYYFLQDGVSVSDFVNMVVAGQDPERERRMAALRSSTANLDGNAGKKIHCAILNSYRKNAKP